MNASMIRAQAAFLDDAFAEAMRSSKAFDAEHDKLARDHAAYRARLDEACRRHGKGAAS